MRWLERLLGRSTGIDPPTHRRGGPINAFDPSFRAPAAAGIREDPRITALFDRSLEREVLRERVGRLGKGIELEIIEVTRSGTTSQAELALWCLSELESDELVWATLRRLCADPELDPEAVSLYLAAPGDERTLRAALAEVLPSAPPGHRIYEALEHVDPEIALPFLLDGLRAGNGSAADALSLIDDPAALDLLLAASRDPDPRVRAGLVAALVNYQVGDFQFELLPRVRARLEELATDADADVRGAAASALGS